MTFGAPTVGEILAERYQLEEHINNDSAGRQVWRGIDVILRRPVAVVLRHPGGDSAAEMLQAAVAASRVIHPNLVGVYDAIDEGDRAYVVREWVDGDVAARAGRRTARSTRRAPPRSRTPIADAVAAVHATGMVHGNVHPGTVLIADDGRVVLADARADDAPTPPRPTSGRRRHPLLRAHRPLAARRGRPRPSLPDAVRDASGAIAAPRQIRAGVPTYLDDLTMDLLDQRLAAARGRRARRRAGPAGRRRRRALLRGRRARCASTARRPPRSSECAAAAAPAAARSPSASPRLLVIAVTGTVFGISALAGGGDRAERRHRPAGRAVRPSAGHAAARPRRPTRSRSR